MTTGIRNILALTFYASYTKDQEKVFSKFNLEGASTSNNSFKSTSVYLWCKDCHQVYIV